MKRGEIYYISKYPAVGCEIEAGRPAVIVSNDANNLFSSTVEVCYMTTQDKKPLPTHVKIESAAKPSTVMCEQITTVAKERIGTYFGECTPEEMKEINEAIMVSVGLETESERSEAKYTPCTAGKNTEDSVRLEAELSVYKELYMALLNRLTKGA